MKNKRGALELSIGTIVIIVLAMSMLILGLVLIKSIFTPAIENVKMIDEKTKSQIDKMFSESEDKKIIVLPSNRIITLQQGEEGSGFAFFIRNVGNSEDTFGYNVNIPSGSYNLCPGYNEGSLEKLITLGKEGSGIKLAGGNALEDPIYVRFSVPLNMPPKCQFRLQIEVKNSAGVYQTSQIDVKFKSK